MGVISGAELVPSELSIFYTRPKANTRALLIEGIEIPKNRGTNSIYQCLVQVEVDVNVGQISRRQNKSIHRH